MRKLETPRLSSGIVFCYITLKQTKLKKVNILRREINKFRTNLEKLNLDLNFYYALLP